MFMITNNSAQKYKFCFYNNVDQSTFSAVSIATTYKTKIAIIMYKNYHIFYIIRTNVHCITATESIIHKVTVCTYIYTSSTVRITTVLYITFYTK